MGIATHREYSPAELPRVMRSVYFDPFGTEHDHRYLLLLGAKEINRQQAEIHGLREEARHHEITSKHWEARVIALEQRLSLCGK